MKKVKNAHCKKLLAAVLTVAALIGLYGCAGSDKKNIASVENMTLTLQGMRGTSVYEFAETDGKTELRRYQKVFSGEEDRLELEASAVCSSETLTELMNSCSVGRWDGFHGKHPKKVLDGIMFRFTAEVNGGETVQAEGSANFPKGYHEFVNGLEKILGEGKNN